MGKIMNLKGEKTLKVATLTTAEIICKHVKISCRFLLTSFQHFIFPHKRQIVCEIVAGNLNESFLLVIVMGQECQHVLSTNPSHSRSGKP